MLANWKKRVFPLNRRQAVFAMLLCLVLAVNAVPALRASALYLITDGEATTAVELAEPVTADKLIVVGAADGAAELRFESGHKVTVTHGTDAVQYATTRTNETADALLKRMGISVGPMEMVKVDVSEPEIFIEIAASFTYYETLTEPAEHATVYTESYKVPKGETQVWQQGMDGTREVVYEVVYADGELDVIREADTAADARTIAARIAQMMADGYPVRDAEPGKTRPCQYDDFCILLRGRSDFALYEAALTALDIPVYADVAADLLDAPHVRPFAALLRVLDNPAQDVELSSVLLSPLYPYTPDDLVQLRAAVRGGSLYAAVLQGSDPRFVPFLQDMEVYRELARTLTVGQLIEELFARTGYLAAVGAMPDGARCRDDLLAFAAWAANAGARGLSALVHAMDAAKAGSGVQAPSIGQSRPGCVSIMTVHRSKGLEFPVVFVANTSHKFNQSDAIYPVLYHKELGIGLMLRAGSSASRYKTLPYTAVVQTIKRETLSEEMRILYVALTRAQDALIITVPLKRPESELKNPAMFASAEATDAEAMLGAQNWALWLLTAAMLHPASEELWKYSELLPHHIPTEAPLNIRLLDPPPAVQAAEPEAPALPDDALTERLLEAFTWQSPNKALETIPVKVSVSAVTHTKQELTLRRPAFLQKSGMTGAERGTAIHAFLQSVPFGPQPPELEAEVQRQLDLHLLDPELAKVLDLEQVRPFFASGVWQRIAAARQVLREEPFITALPAGEVVHEAAGQGRAAKAPVLVQGIADVVLVFDDHAEILDYKTDKSRNATYYIESYAAQLRLYRRAFALRLPVPVTKLTIYSFAMQDEIDIPLEYAAFGIGDKLLGR